MSNSTPMQRTNGETPDSATMPEPTLPPTRTGHPAGLILDGAYDRVPEEQQVSSSAKLAISLYLVGTLLACLALLLVAWPIALAPGTTEPVAIGRYERGLLALAILAGGLGACIHALQSIGAFLGERTMMRSWLPWYYLRPFLGMGLALMAFVVLAGGLVQGSAAALSPFGVAAIGALAGLFSRRAVQKLAEVCDTLFQLRSEQEASGQLKPQSDGEGNPPSPRSRDGDRATLDTPLA